MGINYVMQKHVEETKQPMLAYVSKAPHKTWWLMLAFHETDKPDRLLADLAKAGWAQRWGKPGIPQLPALNGVLQVEFNSPGTGIFGEWLPKERESALSKCRKVLDHHGHSAVPYHKLELSDCL